jgi:acyl-CoA reductase-like NAD-dependent aldehyde dehydrogenase
MLHLPILRWGVPYRSVNQVVTPHFRTREPFVSMSQANTGLIRRDLMKQADARAALQKIAAADLVAMAARAADYFMNDALPLDPESGTMQTAQEYIEQVTATTGMPFSNVRRNMLKVHGVLSKVEEVLSGLTRGLDLSVLDSGYGTVRGQLLSFFPRSEALGVVLPSNSPGVHSLWAPTPVLKIPLVLKPGSAEPWTPLRIINAWVKAGVPAGAFGYYPTDHAGGNEILRSTGRGMVFGDVASTKRWLGDRRVEVHGPGYSKVVIGPDVADQWEQYIDVIAESMSNNGGRSCVNASGVWVTKHGDAIAEALARKLGAVVPRASDDPDAVLAPFADPETAKRISATIDADINSESGIARDVSAAIRASDPVLRSVGEGGRVASAHGGTYLLPTVIRCNADHPLANREFLFPFASVVEVPAAALPACLGPSLVVTCISDDPAFRARFVASPDVDRLNVGPLSTTQIGWDQPHEGNLFEHLYARRAIQRLA